MKPLARKFYESPMTPEEIEAKSFETIDGEAPPHSFSEDQWIVVRRMIHTTANFELAAQTRFSHDAIECGTAALRDGKPIYTDSNMIRAGLSVARLKSAHPEYSKDRVLCHVADEDVAAESKKAGLPRSLFAVRKAAKMIDGGIAVFGNSPIALMELSRMIIEDGVKPALVIAMPVGFVNVVESKAEFMSLGTPFIAIEGRFGGSALAVSVIHSLCSIAVNKGENDVQ